MFEKNPCYCRERNSVPDTGATAYRCLFENRRNGTVAFRDVFGRNQAVSSGSPDSISAVIVKGVNYVWKLSRWKLGLYGTAQTENGQRNCTVPKPLYVAFQTERRIEGASLSGYLFSCCPSIYQMRNLCFRERISRFFCSKKGKSSLYTIFTFSFRANRNTLSAWISQDLFCT